jgi:hypothetical protein
MRRVPRFLVPPEPRLSSWWGSFLLLWRHYSSVDSARIILLSQNLVESEAHLPRRALFTSAFLHFSILFLLVRVSPTPFQRNQTAEARRKETTRIVYDLRLARLPGSLPSIMASGPGGRPGSGARRELLPALGSTAFHRRLRMVSNPPRPDNARQTIIQPSSPPDLRVTQEVRLPNLVVGNPLAIPKPRVDFRIRVPSKAAARAAAPTEPDVVPVPRSASEPVLALGAVVNARPHLPVPPPPALGTAHVPQARNAAAGAGFGASEETSEARDSLLTISVDPAGIMDLLAIPPGSRYGAFSVSPAGGMPGSPGGVLGGQIGAGTDGVGSGGDGSTGNGKGKNGGGGGGALRPSLLSVDSGDGVGPGPGTDGGSGLGENPARLLSAKPGDLVFPVISLPRLRRNNLIVTAGPMGGGGLGVYGALRGGKIYSVFLPMPGKSWALQYCFRGDSTSGPDSGFRAGAVQPDQGLVPPDAVERFDFQRFPVPEDKSNKLIVLQGVIQADGSVAELRVLQGVEPRSDEAALLAFGRWKFIPALRGGKGVAVDILVGIPARVSQVSRNR